MKSSTFYIYARKSVYTEVGESIESQITICKDYIEKNFFDIPHKQILIYKDEGFSGKNTKRPQYLEMLKSVEKARGGYIICYKLDRISRSISDFSSLFDKLEKQNISFISVKEHFDTSTPVGRGMMYICAVFAQMERESIAERVRDNMMFLAKTGRWLGGTPPTGFSSVYTEHILLDSKVKKCSFLETNDDIEVVKLIYQKYLELGSIHLVSKYLAEKNIETVFGNLYTRETVKAILRNPVYCTADKDSFEYFSSQCKNVFFCEKDFYKKLGLMPFNRHNFPRNFGLKPISEWIIALGKHKGIISGKDWLRVQALMGNKKYKTRVRKTEALFSGMIICKDCGYPMRMRTGNHSNTDFYYVCRKKAEYGIQSCNSKNLKGYEFDNLIMQELINMDEKKFKNEFHVKKNTHRKNKLEDQIFNNKCNISKLEKTKIKYIDYLQKLTSLSPLIKEIEIKVTNINSKIEHLTSITYDLETQLQATKNERADLEYIVNVFKKLKKDLFNMDFQTKKSLVRLIVKKLIWSEDKWNIIFNGI